MSDDRPQMCVDRDRLIAWVSGILMERDGDHVTVADDLDWIEPYLEAGGVLALTVAGHVVSTMRLVDGEYREMQED